MRKIFVLAGLFVCAFTYVYINTVLVYHTDIPEVLINYWMSISTMQIFFYTVLLVVPAHLYLVIYGVRKDKMDWSTGVPFFIIPYMLGATVQAMIL